METNLIEITGRTYPVRRSLFELGGKWDGRKKAWMVPADRAERARDLVRTGGASKSDGGRNGSYRRKEYGSNYARFSSGAEVFTNKRGRCEDAPCCGCCS